MSNDEASIELDVTTQVVVERLRAGEPVTVRLWGRSMMPTVWPGTQLRFVPCRIDDVRVGDVVLVRRPSGLCVHRAVEVGATIRTWGDGLLSADAPAGAEAVLGRATGVPLGRGQLRLSSRVARPLNVVLGVAGRRWTAGRARLARSSLRSRALGLVDAVRPARAALQPFAIEPLDPAWRHRLAELELRAGRRPRAEALERWRAALDGRGAAWVARSRRGSPVGWVVVAPEDGVWAVRTWVDPGHRRLGIGTALAQRVLSAASERGWARLRAVDAAALWRKHGFRARDGALERIAEVREVATA